MPGLEVEMVCGTIPVVYLEQQCVFTEHASWMLQTALNASCRVDSLYETFESRRVVSECWRCLALSEDHITLVRMKRPDLRHVSAIGASGKRSVTFALVIALCLDNCALLDGLWSELSERRLEKPFLEVLEQAKVGDSTASSEERLRMREAQKEARRQRRRYQEEEQEAPQHAGGHLECHGVELDVVLGSVPVVSLDPESVFSENVSWLLQTALDLCGKADSCFVYDEDPRIMAACSRDLGLSPHEMGVVRMKEEEVRHIKAVGVSGKRSMMLAVFVAHCLHDPEALDRIFDDVQSYNRQLAAAVDEVMRGARRLTRGVRGLGRSRREREDREEPKRRQVDNGPARYWRSGGDADGGDWDRGGGGRAGGRAGGRGRW